MLQNAFAGRTTQPTQKDLATTLGESHGLWQRLVADLKHDLKIDAEQWHTSSVKLGWSLRLQSKRRNILYLGPRPGYFVAALILGDRAIAEARKSDLPPSLLNRIARAKRYAEGTAIRVEVKKIEDIEAVKTLAKIKAEF